MIGFFNFLIFWFCSEVLFTGGLIPKFVPIWGVKSGYFNQKGKQLVVTWISPGVNDVGYVPDVHPRASVDGAVSHSCPVIFIYCEIVNDSAGSDRISCVCIGPVSDETVAVFDLGPTCPFFVA